ncbi:cationic amino acid transporter [Catenaria anguillulae PL171]|uniref:Cationic amino acid transporter n=1 Tax=Catenaria anguillulae PL171 TaxID=765915 RepID=A0A1Y2HQR9_9FUNG|nr:cationic amino acid transporter [Catenaria anguillulae PL171]
MPSLMRSILAVKSVEAVQTEAGNNNMKRTLSGWDVMLMGIGDIIGTGIFVITGQIAAKYAGPAVVLSFIISATACAFAALSYSELASMLPVSGSAYTFAYASIGELAAFVIAANLVLEYALGSSLAAQGFTAYLLKLLKSFDVHLDPSWTATPWKYDDKLGFLPGDGYINLPALLIVVFISIVLVFGAQASAYFNHGAAITKIAVILLFLFSTVQYIDPAKWTPFIPGPGHGHDYGVLGVFTGATQVFLAYSGFDACSTLAQECRNPKVDMPLGIIGSLVVCTTLYVLTCLGLTGIEDYWLLNTASPIADAVSKLGLTWITIAISIGALAGLVSVQLMNLLSLSRVWYAMANDGLLPPIFGKLHPKTRAPYVAILINMTVCCMVAAFCPIDVIAHMTSSGILFAFALVSAAVGVLRIKRPDVERPFMVPGGPYLVPGLGFVTCMGLIAVSGTTNIIRLVVWVLIAVVVYFAYGRSHSYVNNPHLRPPVGQEWELEEAEKVRSGASKEEVKQQAAA